MNFMCKLSKQPDIQLQYRLEVFNEIQLQFISLLKPKKH